ncbi:pyocin knob domain-containing protein, partial [Lelliottia aquatilis]|uniref:pyocin knob domain-containing protein n=1 Tax=Lelliottia aquatilis TaxID=2080838 RepID=UPI001FAF74E8
IGSSTTTADENDEFTDGDPQTQVPCTWVMAAWLNTLQRELVHLCEEAGITIDPEDDTQVYQAIAQLLNTSTEGMVKTVNEHQPDEHGNVKLGSAADADIVTSMVDTTNGRVPVVGWMGVGSGARDTVVNSERFASFWRDLSIAMSGITMPYDGTPSQNYFGVGLVGGELVAQIGTKSGDNNISWAKLFGENNPPTAVQSGAMPYFGTALNVDLNTLGAYSAAGVHYQPATAGATAANHYPMVEAGTLVITPSAYGCQQEYTTFGTGRKFLRGLSGAWNGTNGPWGNWNELYGPTNPNEIVSSSANSYRIAYGNYGAFWRNDGINLYLMLTNNGDPHGNYNSLRPFRVNVETGEAVMHKLNLEDFGYFDARYLSASTTLTRLGAQVVVDVPNHATVSAPAGCVQSAVKCGSDGALTGMGYRPLQILVNGTWVNVQSL